MMLEEVPLKAYILQVVWQAAIATSGKEVSQSMGRSQEVCCSLTRCLQWALTLHTPHLLPWCGVTLGLPICTVGIVYVKLTYICI